jgi:hypothetical protein
MLENEADVALLHGLLRRILVAEEDRASGRAFEPGDQPQQRGLAGAGRAEERDQFTRPDVEGNVFERGKAAEFLANVLDADFHGGLDLSVPAAGSDLVAVAKFKSSL